MSPSFWRVKFFVLICFIFFTKANFASQLGQGYDFPNNGKIAGEKQKEIYVLSVPDIDDFEFSKNCLEALNRNQKFLKKLSKDFFSVGNLKISSKSLRVSTQLLINLLKQGNKKLLPYFDFYRISGEDGCGNVHFTGYFTPEVEARYKPDSVYRFPFYYMPKGIKPPLPTRKQIDHEHALAGKNLEMAYTASLLDNYFIHVQGSAILSFDDGTKRRIGFDGKNGHPYVSIGRYLVETGEIPPEKISLKAIRKWIEKHPEEMVPLLNRNPSYCFFRWLEGPVIGSTGVPLVSGHSIAVDPKFIPHGACLLAKIPELDDEGNFIRHRWDLLFAHDIGGAIKGPGHVDLYCGTGKKAENIAGDLHHYGQIWLLIPKGVKVYQ